MDAVQPKGVICQSCGMPMISREDFGTNGDESRNQNYCHYCYESGQFSEPDISIAEMINKVAMMMVQMQKIPEKQARKMTGRFIPQLKRWRQV